MMESLATFLILVAFLSTMHPLKDSAENEIVLYHESSGIEQTFKYEVKPLSEFLDENIIKQKFDYSCGSAALATLLNYHLGEDFSEQQVIQGLMEFGDMAMIEKRRAFSLFDMKKFVSVLGYNGAGYTADMEDLRGLEEPCILPITFYGYNHFVIYKGMYGDHVFFADPYMGNISFTISQFEEMWYKNILFLVSDGDIAFDALALKEDDLRIIDFDFTRNSFQQAVPHDMIADEKKFKESMGQYQYKNVNVK